jgi:hypothetical protein
LAAGPRRVAATRAVFAGAADRVRRPLEAAAVAATEVRRRGADDAVAAVRRRVVATGLAAVRVVVAALPRPRAVVAVLFAAPAARPRAAPPSRSASRSACGARPSPSSPRSPAWREPPRSRRALPGPASGRCCARCSVQSCVPRSLAVWPVCDEYWYGPWKSPPSCSSVSTSVRIESHLAHPCRHAQFVDCFAGGQNPRRRRQDGIAEPGTMMR